MQKLYNTLLVVFLLYACLAVDAFIPPDSFFQLDGNAAGNPDWEALFNSGLPGFTFEFEPGSGNRAFTGGGSKDVRDINFWLHAAAQTPDKNFITDAYAAAATYNGQRFIYFGADRFANNGDSTIGFWFFQNAVSPLADGTFSGVHADGDLLVVVNFENPLTFTSFTWENDVLEEGPSSGNSACTADRNSIDFCSITNQENIILPWAYTPKAPVANAPANTAPPKSFIEGVVNLNALGLGDLCFASFMAVTRASTSKNAVLKDFISSNFEPCTYSVSTSCVQYTLDCVAETLVYTFRIDVNNDGGVALSNVVIDFNFPGHDQTATIPSLAPGASDFREFLVDTDCLLDSADLASFDVSANVNGQTLLPEESPVDVPASDCPCV